jgi:hypothetical protein
MAKVGGMLEEQLRRPGNPQLSHDARIGLDDLGINMTQSSRWQWIVRKPGAGVTGQKQEAVTWDIVAALGFLIGRR